MAEIIQSISFQENKVSWVQASRNDTKINIGRTTESLLPFIINYDNIQKQGTSLQIANHLKTLAANHDLSMPNALDDVRFLLSAKFMFIKKIFLDAFISKDQIKEFVKAEYSQILTEPCDDYIIYLPEHSRETGKLTEILTVALKKSLFNFFKKIADEAELPLSQMSVNCLTIYDLFRKIFPDQIGQSLLANFTERGLELVICDEKHFLNFTFRPYSKSLQSIEHLEDEEVISGFNSVLNGIQSPDSIDRSLYSISKIYFYGNYFKPEWLEALEAQVNIPVQMFDPMQTRKWRIIADDPSFNPDQAYRLVDPFSNLL